MNVLINEKMMDISKFETRKLDCGENVWVKPAPRKNSTETLFNEKGKVCKECEEFVEWGEYDKNKVCIGGCSVKCKRCRKQYCVDNREIALERSRQYRIDNREQCKQYRIDNREKALECNKQWGLSNTKYNSTKLPIGYTCKSDEDGLLLISCYKCGKLHHTTNSQLGNLLQAQAGKLSASSNIYCSDHCKETCNVFGVRQSRLANRHLQNLPMHTPKTIKPTICKSITNTRSTNKR